ncbi:MAG: Ni/Fe-hydrogenase, b-type cytochrome subunit [Deltaproteobacteria bacterium]|nr:Ni/Fe-hydrogenase, b-type cytochrome subunit [Deltaproteobacteria bacterium]
MEKRYVKKEWSVAVRTTHWAKALAIFVLTATGFYIAMPFSVLTGETVDKFFMGDMRFVHILFGVLLVFIFIWRTYLAFFSSFHADWKDYFAWTDIKNAIQQMKFYALLTRKPHEHRFLYGPLQSVAYGGQMIMLLIIVLTGIILTGACYHAGVTAMAYEALKPLENMMGGLAGVRYIHHIFTWLFILFFAVHLYMAFWYDAVFEEGTVSSMICGSLFKRSKE